MKAMNQKQADLFMKKLTDVVESSSYPMCLAVSVGMDDFFVVTNSSFSEMNKDTIFCGMSNCLNRALLNSEE